MPIQERVRVRCFQAGKSATCAACRSVAGAANGHWNGGRTRHKAGSVMSWAPGHPRAGKEQYVFEHILVMENISGAISDLTNQCITGTACEMTTAHGT